MKVLELTFYSVTSEGVIIVPDIPEPKTRSDVFERVDTRDVHTRQELIELIESCPPLEQHFLDLSLAYLRVHAQPSSFVDNLVAQRGRRSDAQQLILRALRRNPDGGWRQWIEYSGDAALEVFLQQVRDWLDEKIDWNESDSCGWHVPAVPTEVGDTYWGYSSVPLRGCRWWHLLEPREQRDRHPEYFLDDHGWLDHLTVGARDGAWYLRRYFRPEALTVAIRMVARAAPAEGLSIVRRFRTRTGSYRVAGRRFRSAELARRWIVAAASPPSPAGD